MTARVHWITPTGRVACGATHAEACENHNDSRISCNACGKIIDRITESGGPSYRYHVHHHDCVISFLPKEPLNVGDTLELEAEDMLVSERIARIDDAREFFVEDSGEIVISRQLHFGDDTVLQ